MQFGFARRCLPARMATLGPGHADTMLSMNNLAVAYQAAGRTAEAISLHKRELETCRMRFGPNHPDTLTSLNNLAAAYQSAGRAAEAIPLHQQELERCNTALGPDHPDTLTSMHNLAVAYRLVGHSARRRALVQGGHCSPEGEAACRSSRHARQHEPTCVNISGNKPMGRSRSSVEGVPGNPGTDSARSLASLRHDEPARRRPGRSEEVRRGRTTVNRWLPRHEDTRIQDSGAPNEGPGRGGGASPHSMTLGVNHRAARWRESLSPSRAGGEP